MRSFLLLNSAVVIGVSLFWIILFTMFLVQPVLVEQKIQYLSGSEKRDNLLTFLRSSEYVTKAIDFVVEGNRTRTGVGGTYYLTNKVVNQTVIVETYKIPLNIFGWTVIKIYAIDGPTLDGKILKGEELAVSTEGVNRMSWLFWIALIGGSGGVGLVIRSKAKSQGDEQK